MFERKDSQNWAKWKFYPGAITILIPRLVFGVFLAFLLVILTSILLIGHNRDKAIKPGCRKFLLRLSYRVFVNLQAFFSFWTFLSYSYTKDTSYEYYLG